MKKLTLVKVNALAFGAIIALASTQNAQAADTDVTLTTTDYYALEVPTTVSITPAPEDYAANSVTQSTSGITVQTNNASGCEVSVSAETGDGRISKITPGDITLIVNGSEKAPLTTTPAVVYSSAQTAGTNATMSVKVSNLHSYDGNETGYTNKLTFTIAAAS